MNKQIVNLKSIDFKPFGEFLLVEPDKIQQEKTSSTGVIISIKQDSSLDRSTMGRVVAVGLEIDKIFINDVVLWPNTDGIDIEFNDGLFILLRYKSIIGYKKK